MGLGCSKLNYDLCYNLHVIDYCNCLCGALVEDAYHFFLVCPKYNEIRTVLCNAALPLCPPTLKHCCLEIKCCQLKTMLLYLVQFTNILLTENGFSDHFHRCSQQFSTLHNDPSTIVR